MLMRFDPLHDIDRLARLLTPPAATARPTTAMPMDAYRDGDRLVIHFDLPGVSPEQIELTVDRDSLTVRAERQWKRTEGQEIIVAERPQGAFSRQLILGANLDGDALQASYEQGVLTLKIPLSERARPRKIEVASGNGRGTRDGAGTITAASDGTSAGSDSAASSGTGTAASESTAAASGSGSAGSSAEAPAQPAMSGVDQSGSSGR
jgi:HSP20 family protein